MLKASRKILLFFFCKELYVVLLACCCINTYAQSKESNSEFDKGVYYYNCAAFDSAIVHFERSYTLDKADDSLSKSIRLRHTIDYLTSCFVKAGKADVDSMMHISVFCQLEPINRNFTVCSDSIIDQAMRCEELQDTARAIGYYKIALKYYQKKKWTKSSQYANLLNHLCSAYAHMRIKDSTLECQDSLSKLVEAGCGKDSKAYSYVVMLNANRIALFFNDYKLSYLLVKKLVGSYFNKSLDEFQCQAMGIASYSLYRLGENVLAYVFANQIKDVDKEVLPMLDFLNYKSGGEIEKKFGDLRMYEEISDNVFTFKNNSGQQCCFRFYGDSFEKCLELDSVQICRIQNTDKFVQIIQSSAQGYSNDSYLYNLESSDKFGPYPTIGELVYLGNSYKEYVFGNNEYLVCTNGKCQPINESLELNYENIDKDGFWIEAGPISYKIPFSNIHSVNDVLKGNYRNVEKLFKAKGENGSLYFFVDYPMGNKKYEVNIRNWFSKYIYDKLYSKVSGTISPFFKIDANDGSTMPNIIDYYGKMFYYVVNGKEQRANVFPSYSFVFSKQFESDQVVTYYIYSNDKEQWFHDLPYKDLISFDKETGDVIEFEDVCIPGQREMLKKKIVDGICKVYNKKNSLHLSEEEYLPKLNLSLMETINSFHEIDKEECTITSGTDDLMKSHHIAYLANGISVVFQPYELDCFVNGFYYINIPYEKVNGIVIRQGNLVKNNNVKRQARNYSVTADSEYLEQLLAGQYEKAYDMIARRLKSNGNRNFTLLSDASICALALKKYERCFLLDSLILHYTDINSKEFGCFKIPALCRMAMSQIKTPGVSLFSKFEKQVENECLKRYGKYSDYYINYMMYLMPLNLCAWGEKRISHLEKLYDMAVDVFGEKDDHTMNLASLLLDFYDKEKNTGKINALYEQLAVNVEGRSSDRINPGNSLDSYDDATKILMKQTQYNLQQQNYPKALELSNRLCSRHKFFLDNYDKEYYEILRSRSLIGLNRLEEAASQTNEIQNQIKEKVLEKFKTEPGEKRKKAWDDAKAWFLDILPRIAWETEYPEIINQAFDAVLFGKGILLNTEMELKKIIQESKNGEALRIYQRYIEIASKYNKMISEQPDNQAEIKSLKNKLGEAEKLLLEKSKEFKDYTENLEVTNNEIVQSMTSDEVVVEFHSFYWDNETYYVAYVLLPNLKNIRQVKLFSERELREVMAQNEIYSTPALTKMLWDKLNLYIEGAKIIYFVSSGLLYNLAIENLPCSNDSTKFMFDKWSMRRLSSSREIIARNKNVRITNGAIYGGIEYNAPGVNNASLKHSKNRGALVYLPYTLKEAKSIHKILSSCHVNSDLYLGERGTEKSFKALSGRKLSIIHIGTHGFYEEETSDSIAGTKSQEEDLVLSRAGLLFANPVLKQKNESGEDGILTASEVSVLDLRGAKLVALSACQTGLGEITSEGVYGLQRGFKKAGAEAIIMSLWQVNDEATYNLMTEFYLNWIKKGMTKYQSLEAAKRKIRNSRMWHSPFFWAGFILLDGIN